jgi:hypothetical protein
MRVTPVTPVRRASSSQRAAIDAVRAARGSNALFNAHFVEWLYEEAGETVPASERWRDWDADAG